MSNVSNVSYELEFIEKGIAYIRETYDLTDPNGPGVLIRAGQIVNCDREGIKSATRRIMMPVHQAKELGIIPEAAE